MPKASNLSLKASSTLKFTDEENNSSDTSVNLGIDIISSTHLNQKINQIKADRAILEAKRAFQNRTLEAEKEFYSEMKNLFENKSTIISKQKDLYEDSISFDEVKAKGYSQSSSKYRQAYMKVLSDKHEIDTVAHTFEHNCAVFAAKCGIVFESNEIPEDFLPADIADSSAIDILSFEKKNYAKIEKAVYLSGTKVLMKSGKCMKDVKESLPNDNPNNIHFGFTNRVFATNGKDVFIAYMKKDKDDKWIWQTDDDNVAKILNVLVDPVTYWMLIPKIPNNVKI